MRKYSPNAKLAFLSTNKVYGDRPNFLPLKEKEKRYELNAKHKYFKADKRHLYLEIESKFLSSLSKLDAQRNIMKILKEELKTNIHALEIKIR